MPPSSLAPLCGCSGLLRPSHFQLPDPRIKAARKRCAATPSRSATSPTAQFRLRQVLHCGNLVQQIGAFAYRPLAASAVASAIGILKARWDSRSIPCRTPRGPITLGARSVRSSALDGVRTTASARIGRERIAFNRIKHSNSGTSSALLACSRRPDAYIVCARVDAQGRRRCATTSAQG